MSEPLEFTTETGCTVSIVPTAETRDPGAGILRLWMKQLEDGRRAEVQLTYNEMRQLARILGEAIPMLKEYTTRMQQSNE